ncbi:Putative cytochrome P450 [Colletotrichum destructivum]|uniref:Cytochrome P450 n=1 Tax=Colletotrichum destructivum TaxID=34406 RepID=A0AAX4J4W8_9PEZI|nr:Putative cytochrome P450 [Colletotrichum destructivum]
MLHLQLDLPLMVTSFGVPRDALVFLLPFLVGVVSVSTFLLYQWSSPDLSGFPTAVEDPGDSSPEQKSPIALGPVGRIIQASYNKYKRPFVMKLSLGTSIVLPHKYIDDFKNNKDFDNHDFVVEMFQTKIPGLHPVDITTHDDRIFPTVVKSRMTQALGHLTAHLKDEASTAVERYFSGGGDWKAGPIYGPIVEVMSSLVSLAFVGGDFQQRDEWRALTSAYIGKLFPAHHIMRSWPRWSRSYVHWFLPELQDVRARLKEINNLLEPHVQRRIAAREQREHDGKQPLKSLDSVDWALDAAKGRTFDVIGCQLALTIAALHTSSNTTWNSLLDIVYNQEIIQPLREEIIRVVQEDDGLKTVSIAKLELLDSCMKESQRMHPIQYGVMGRRVRKTTQLHDGTRIPKGVITIVAPPAMLDADVFENPGKWDGYRFLKKRQQPGEEKKWLFTATSPEQYAFGTGAHACPGRHFAGTTIKLILAHLLMRYDWKRPEGAERRPDPIEMSLDWAVDPSARLAWKPRSPEVAL